MVVATCVITLELSGVGSLKEKRSILHSIIARLRREFNLSVAEVGGHDAWGQAVVGLAAVGNDKGYVHGQMEKAVGWIAEHRPDVPIYDYSIEFV
jgi:uncharacterized protein YlxP (DUF503 family)